MPKLSEKGVAQIWLFVLLVVGLAVGLYLVQTRTNLLPKAYENQTAIVESSVSCVPGTTDLQTISARWQDSSAASYQVEIKEPGGTVGLKCVGKATSYTFEGEYSTSKNYTVYVYSHSGENCTGAGGAVHTGTTKVTNAVCTNETADSFCKPLVNSTVCGQPAYDSCVADCDGTKAIYRCTPKDYKYTSVCGGTIECASENRRCDPKADNPLDK